jgi:hypothetical protein
MKPIAILTDIRTVSFGVLAIGAGLLTMHRHWVELGMLVFSWSVVQLVQLAIDEDTRVGEVFGTIGLLLLCSGLYYYPMPSAFLAIGFFCAWTWLDY